MEWWKNTLIGGMFFLALSPGFLLTLPPKGDSEKGLIGKGIFHSLQTSNASIIVHTIVFLVVVGGLLWYLDSGSSNSVGSMPTVDDSSSDGGEDDASGAEADNEEE